MMSRILLSPPPRVNETAVTKSIEPFLSKVMTSTMDKNIFIEFFKNPIFVILMLMKPPFQVIRENIYCTRIFVSTQNYHIPWHLHPPVYLCRGGNLPIFSANARSRFYCTKKYIIDPSIVLLSRKMVDNLVQSFKTLRTM